MAEIKRADLRRQRKSEIDNKNNYRWLIGIVIGILAQVLVLYGARQMEFNGFIFIVLAFGDVVMAIGVNDWQNRRNNNKKKKA